MKILLIALMLLFIGCGDGTEYTDHNVTNGEVIVLENNQTIGYKPNTDVQIVNVGDNSFYISCNEGECPVHIGDLDESSTTNTTNDGNSSING